MFPEASILNQRNSEIAAILNIQPAGRVLKLWAPFTTTTARQVGRLEQNPAQESAQEQRHGTIGEGRASGPDSAQGMTARRPKGERFSQDRTQRGQGIGAICPATFLQVESFNGAALARQSRWNLAAKANIQASSAATSA